MVTVRDNRLLSSSAPIRHHAELAVEGVNLLVALAAFSKKPLQLKIKLKNVNNIDEDERRGYNSQRFEPTLNACTGISLETPYLSVEMKGYAPVCGLATEPLTWSNAAWETWENNGISIWANLTIAVIMDISEYEGTKLEPSWYASFLNERILKEEIGTDVTVVAKNGVGIKCHKSFLMVHGPALTAMFQTQMVEAQTSTLQLSEMAEESVRALLDYFYYLKIDGTNWDCKIALELFQAARKYDIKRLEEAMKYILLQKNNSWFTLSTALKLFLFARNLSSEGDGLKMKAVQVLKSNVQELQALPDYRQLFLEQPEAAMDLCRSFAV